MTENASTEQKQLGFETLSLHAGQVVDPLTRSRAVPIYQTTSYVFNDTDQAADLFALRGTWQHLHPHAKSDHRRARAAIAALEGGIGALAFASGQAPIVGDPQHRQRRRQDRLHHQPVWRHLQPLPLHPAEVRHQRQVRRTVRR